MQLAERVSAGPAFAVVHTVVGYLDPEAQRIGGEKGREAQRKSSVSMRALWYQECIRLFVDGFDAGTFVRRDDFIEGLRAFNLHHNLKGKRGEQVKRSTISGWLTKAVEDQICREAIETLVYRGRS